MKNLLRSKKFHRFLGILVSVALIGWMCLSLEWGDVAQHLGQIRYFLFIPAVVLMAVHFWLRAIRWRYLLPKSESEVPTIELFNAIVVGNFATFVLPLRAGEVIRPYLLSLRSGYSFSSGFASVVIERFLDLAAVLLLFVSVVFLAPEMAPWVYNGALTLTVLICALILFILIGTFFPRQIMSIVEWLLQHAPETVRKPLLHFVGDFLIGAAVLSSGMNFILVTCLTAAVWTTTVAFFYLFLLLFSLEGNLLLALSLTVIVALAVAAPSAPGFIGVYQIACIAGFVMFGMSEEIGAAYGIVSHVIQYVVFVSYGIYVLTRYDLSLAGLRKRQEVKES